MSIEPPAQQTNGETDEPRQPQALAGIGAAIGGLVAVLGTLVFTGTLERLPRNQPVKATLAFSAVIAAAAFWTWATVLSTDQARRARALKWTAIMLYSAGLTIAVTAIFATYSQDEQPTIAANFSLDDGLTSTVRVGRLASDDYVNITVHGLRRPPGGGQWQGFRLYAAAVGPDESGQIEHGISLPIASGTYEIIRIRAATSDDRTLCAPIEQTDDDAVLVGADALQELIAPKTGCVMLTLPRFARAPELNATFQSETGEIAVSLGGENVSYRTLLQLSGRKGPRSVLVAREILMPGADGGLQYERSFKIPSHIKSVCALATWYRSGDPFPALRCPTEADSETVLSILRVDQGP